MKEKRRNMPENEFEKHVQEKLEELKLRPSDVVWRSVEMELQKKKRRRVVFIVFLLAGLGLFGYSGYFLFSDPKPEIVQQQPKDLPTAGSENKNIDKNTELPSAETETSRIDNDINHIETETEDLPNNEVIPSPNNKITQKTIKAEQIEKRIVKKERKTLVPVFSPKNKPSIEQIVTDKKQEKGIVQNNEKEINENKELKDEMAVKKLADKTNVTENSVTQNSVAENELPTEKTGNDPVVEKENAGKIDEEDVLSNENDKKVAASKKKNSLQLKWGVELGAGVTSSRTGPLTLGTSQMFADAATINNSTATGGGFANPVRSPSSVQPGPAFKAGVIAEAKLTKRSSISSGLRYSYLSEKIKVGQYSNTANWYNSYSMQNVAGGFYRGAQEKEYTNKYHFIELPLTYHLQMNKSAKTPIFWNAGLSVAYLAGTNALVYDSTMGGIYYKESDVFNKWHVNLNTGFSFRFGNKIQWSLGPELSLDMSRLLKQEIYTKERYLLYGGLSAKVFLPTKKK